MKSALRCIHAACVGLVMVACDHAVNEPLGARLSVWIAPDSATFAVAEMSGGLSTHQFVHDSIR